MNELIVTKLMTTTLMTLWLTGCCGDRVSSVVREAADRQAEQNQSMAQLQREVAEGTRQLVEADAQSRTEIIGVHRDLQTERIRLDNSWDQLQRERRSDSLLISMIPTVGAVVVVCLLLGFCWQALFRAHGEDVSQAELSSLLVEELVGESQLLLQSDSQLLAEGGNPPDEQSLNDELSDEGSPES